MFFPCACSVLSVLLWPLVVYHELIQRMYTGLEPILMKLDYSMKGETEHRKHDKRSECCCDTARLQIYGHSHNIIRGLKHAGSN